VTPARKAAQARDVISIESITKSARHILPSGRFAGWEPEPADHNDFVFDPKKAAKFRGVKAPSLTKLPSKVDLREDGTLSPAKDQGALGSCTGNGIAAVVEECYNRMGIGAVRTLMSRLQIYYNERAMEGSINDDAGAFIRDGIKSVAKLGVAPETLWPYNIARFTEKPPQSAYDEAIKHQALTYATIDNNGVQTHVKAALAARTPVVFGFSVYDAYENVGSDGVMHEPPANAPLRGGHCTYLFGYETLSWRVPRDRREWGLTRGSWSEGFGDKGDVYILMNWLCARGYRNADDFWAIQSMEV
jgi:C1A family cysteine protease